MFMLTNQDAGSGAGTARRTRPAEAREMREICWSAAGEEQCQVPVSGDFEETVGAHRQGGRGVRGGTPNQSLKVDPTSGFCDAVSASHKVDSGLQVRATDLAIVISDHMPAI